MIRLSGLQKDAFLEVCNIGMSKAAKQLSILLNCQVLLDNPQVELIKFDEVMNNNIVGQDVIMSIVMQQLSDDIEGSAILVFKRESTHLLVESVIGQGPHLSEKEIRACEQEAMLEIGNIVISSCVTAVVNLLEKKVQLSPPKYLEGRFKDILKSDIVAVESYVLLISTMIKAKEDTLSGELMFISSSSSLANILHAINKLLER